jgi:hypothetical protein
MLMKGFILAMAIALGAMSATAQTKEYTDELAVTINGNGAGTQKTTIIVTENSDGTYRLALNKFVLGNMIPVGNIVIDGIETNGDDVKNFATVQEITITPGDGNAGSWIGPSLGKVPVNLEGKMSDERLYCTIEIDLTGTLGQAIRVTFGSDDFTGIENINSVEEGKIIYDLTGRRVETIKASGIYIINGKKQFIVQ